MRNYVNSTEKHTMQVGIFGLVRSAILRLSSEAVQYTLPGSQQNCVSVRPAGQVVEVLSGAAWIACNGQDVELTSGQRRSLPCGGDAALISALGPATLTFRIHASERKCSPSAS